MNQLLESLYRQHRQGLYSLAVSITGSHQLAEDSVQNAFARLFGREIPGSIPGSIPGNDPVAYVYKSVRNSAIDTCRSAKRQSRLKESLFNGFRVTGRSETTPDENLLTQERSDLLREAIACLSEPEREAVVLRAFAGLTFAQAGEVANVSTKTVATRYRRALMKLADRLQDMN